MTKSLNKKFSDFNMEQQYNIHLQPKVKYSLVQNTIHTSDHNITQFVWVLRKVVNWLID